MIKNTNTTRFLLATAAALSLGLARIDVAEASGAAQVTPPDDSTPSTGSAMGSTGAWTMGPGMMSNWTPEQRREHWAQMRQWGYGPGMMRNMSPEQWRQHWAQMRQWGYGPGAMMGWPSRNATSRSNT